MIEVYVNCCYSKSVFYFICYDKIWTYPSKVVCGAMTAIILNQWIPLKSEYELVNVEINKSKYNVLVENKLLRRNIYFIRNGN